MIVIDDNKWLLLHVVVELLMSGLCILHDWHQRLLKLVIIWLGKVIMRHIPKVTHTHVGIRAVCFDVNEVLRAMLSRLVLDCVLALHVFGVHILLAGVLVVGLDQYVRVAYEVLRKHAHEWRHRLLPTHKGVWLLIDIRLLKQGIRVVALDIGRVLLRWLDKCYIWLTVLIPVLLRLFRLIVIKIIVWDWALNLKHVKSNCGILTRPINCSSSNSVTIKLGGHINDIIKVGLKHVISSLAVLQAFKLDDHIVILDVMIFKVLNCAKAFQHSSNLFWLPNANQLQDLALNVFWWLFGDLQELFLVFLRTRTNKLFKEVVLRVIQVRCLEHLFFGELISGRNEIVGCILR